MLKQIIEETYKNLRQDTRTQREIAKISGINATRLNRIYSGRAKLTAEELSTLVGIYEIKYVNQAEIKAQEIKEKAWEEIYQSAEAQVAKRYGITPELLAWRLTDPKLKAMA